MSEAREKVYHIRLSPSDAAELDELTKLYGYRFAADLVRNAIKYVARKRPALGEVVKPPRRKDEVSK
jgi:hypothetical protein